MSTFTICEYNVLFRNDAEVVEGDLHQLEADEGCQLMVLNEAGPTVDKGVDAFVRTMGWREYRPHDTGSNRILWNPDEWRAAPQFGVRKLSDKGPVKYTPPTFLIWQGLVHRPSNTHQLVYGTHLTPGYAKPGDVKHEQPWRDTSTRTALLRVAAQTASHMAELDQYRIHHLLGDLNARQNNRDEWWYPTPLLESAWERDTMPKAIDYMLHSRLATSAGLRVAKRWNVRGHGLDSDHGAQLKRMTV